MDEPAFVGCLVLCRLLGVIEAKQTEKGKTTRNDRLIAVSADSRVHEKLKAITDLDSALLDEIEHFFVSYNAAQGRRFKPGGRLGAKRAEQLLNRAIANFKAEGR